MTTLSLTIALCSLLFRSFRSNPFLSQKYFLRNFLLYMLDDCCCQKALLRIMLKALLWRAECLGGMRALYYSHRSEMRFFFVIRLFYSKFTPQDLYFGPLPRVTVSLVESGFWRVPIPASRDCASDDGNGRHDNFLWKGDELLGCCADAAVSCEFWRLGDWPGALSRLAGLTLNLRFRAGFNDDNESVGVVV